MTDLSALLRPQSVAVVGASGDPLKRGHQAVRRLLEDGFPHPIYPVNPRANDVCGLRAYPSLEAIDGPVDLALVATPAASTPQVLRQCAARGVRAAVVIAVGFGELGVQGRLLEVELARIASEAGIALVGPNTNGVFNLPARLNLVGVPGVPEGDIALICQSGNVGLAILTQVAYETDLGFSAYVGIGNEAGVRYDEALRALGADPNTRAIVLYVEGFRDGRAFLQAAREVAVDKPVIVYKAGRTSAAAVSARSHTGVVAGSPRVADAVLRQAGVLVVDRTDELVAVCEAVLKQPPLAGSRVAVLSDGGGHATVAADALSERGLELPPLDAVTRRRLADLLPEAASTRNPVDVAGAADRDPLVLEACTQALLDDPGVDAVLCVGLLGGYGIRFDNDLAEVEEQAARGMAKRADEAGKALIVQSVYAPARPHAHALLRGAGTPVTASVETAAQSLAALRDRGRMLADRDARSTLACPADSGPGVTVRTLPEPTGRRLLEAHGLASGDWRLAASPDEAAAAAAELGGSVALKIVSPEIVHKSDAGGVRLGVTPAEAARAYADILGTAARSSPSARLDGVLVTPMAPIGVELIVGAVRDPAFGPVIIVGAGGTAVEVLDDLAFRAAPVTPLDCREMLDELAIAPLLGAFRGRAAPDREKLVTLLLAVSDLVVARPDLVELDLNPVIGHADGVALVDVRVVLRASDATGAGGDQGS